MLTLDRSEKEGAIVWHSDLNVLYGFSRLKTC